MRPTFLRAQLSGGNTNTLPATAIAVEGDRVLVDLTSAAWPPAAGHRRDGVLVGAV